MDFVADFIDFLRKNGIGPAEPRQIIADDRKNRYTVDGDNKGSKNGTYQLAVSGDFAYGWARWHKDDKTYTYSSASSTEITPEERYQLKQAAAWRRKERADRRVMDADEAAAEARRMWRAARADYPQGHMYARKKNIDLAGVRVSTAGEILIPMGNWRGQLRNLQRIDRRGGKWFLDDADVEGCYHPIGDLIPMTDVPIIVCEGWATGKSIRRLTGCPVRCAMVAGNLLPVGMALRRKYKFTRILFAADFDAWTLRAAVKREHFKDLDTKAIAGNDPRWQDWRNQNWLYDTGGDKAWEAAKKCRGIMVPFPAGFYDHPQKPTDYNDLELIGAGAAAREHFRGFL